MKAYINATSSISPQSTFVESNYLLEKVTPELDYFKAIEPNYREFLDPKMARRMARIIKMGVVTSRKCLEKLEGQTPGAIIIGTGLGCLQDTAKFLKDIVETDEGLLSPTAFIQSTHNTIAGQIALLINCQNHNFTYANRGFSFENALQDAIMQLEEGVDNILVGGMDEVILETNRILKKMDCFKNVNEKQLLPNLGEGASMFLISSKPSSNTLATIEGTKMLFKPNDNNIVINAINDLLNQAGISMDELDGVVLGNNGSKSDALYADLDSYLTDKAIYQFKNLSGEYFTVSAFGIHLASKMIANQTDYLDTLVKGERPKIFNNLLVYNHNNADYHSITLLSKC